MTIMAMITATITTTTNGNSLPEHSPRGTPAVRSKGPGLTAMIRSTELRR
jgi:hypothetical protein